MAALTNAKDLNDGTDTLTVALNYVRNGWSLLPIWWVEEGKCACADGLRCKSPGKHPIGHMAPSGFNSASKDPDTIRQWVTASPNMNLAIATGAASNIVVLDLDLREVEGEDVDGEFELRAWLAARGVDLPDTLTSSTGGGGKHVILSLPATSGVRPVISSRANWLPGVDIRGDGGYIVAPPSQHISGEFYRWDSSRGVSAITQELLTALSTKQRTSALTGKPMPSLGDGDSIDVQKLMREGLRMGGRDDGFVRLVGVLRARGDSLETAQAIITEVWKNTDQKESDYFPLATAMEKVQRGYARWDAPEEIGEVEMLWAQRAAARATRRHAALGDTLSSGLGNSPLGTPGMDNKVPISGSQGHSNDQNQPPEDGIDEDEWEDDDEDDRDPVQEFNIAELMSGGDIEREPPTMLSRADGKHLIYAGKLHSIYGEPGHGKTWVALHLVRERLEAGESVVYFDYDEDDGGRSMALRLKELGMTPDKVSALHYFNPQGIGRDGSQWARMRKLIRRHQPTLVVVDTMAPALVELGLNEKDNAEVGTWYRHARWLLSGATPRPALVIVDHVVKSGEGRGRWARGAGDKLGRLHAAYAVESTTPFSRTTPGQINLLIAKDRGGEVGREGEAAATVKFNPTGKDGHLEITVEVPGSSSLADLAQAHENVIAEARRRLISMIEAEPANRSWPSRDLKRGANMKPAQVDEALEQLVDDGVLVAEAHGRSTHYVLATSITE